MKGQNELNCRQSSFEQFSQSCTNCPLYTTGRYCSCTAHRRSCRYGPASRRKGPAADKYWCAVITTPSTLHDSRHRALSSFATHRDAARMSRATFPTPRSRFCDRNSPIQTLGSISETGGRAAIGIGSERALPDYRWWNLVHTRQPANP